MTEYTCKMFADEQENVLFTALTRCAVDYAREQLEPDVNADPTDYIYHYVESTPKASLVVELSAKLREMGYAITASESIEAQKHKTA